GRLLLKWDRSRTRQSSETPELWRVRLRKRTSAATKSGAAGPSDEDAPVVDHPFHEQQQQGRQRDPLPGLAGLAARRYGGQRRGAAANLLALARLDVALVGVEQVHRERPLHLAAPLHEVDPRPLGVAVGEVDAAAALHQLFGRALRVGPAVRR